MRFWVVVDEGCQECGVESEPVGYFATEEAANEAAEQRNAATKGWREHGQTRAKVHAFEAEPCPCCGKPPL